MDELLRITKGAEDIVNFYSCVSGVEACNQDALQHLIDNLENGGIETPFQHRCNAFRAANESVWMQVFDFAMAQSDVGPRRQAMGSIECTQNPKLIQHILNTALEMDNVLGANERSNIIVNVARQNHQGFEEVIDFIEKNHKVINEK
jgi:hypothetical protein